MEKRSNDPSHVDISLSQGVDITWSDGHQSRYALQYLRDQCPCASCRNNKNAPAAPTAFPMFKPATRLTGAEAVGRYAVQLQWSDGHNTGIYSFDHLRDICPCPECTAKRA